MSIDERNTMSMLAGNVVNELGFLLLRTFNQIWDGGCVLFLSMSLNFPVVLRHVLRHEVVHVIHNFMP